MPGTVQFTAQECPCFEKPTVIEPQNVVPIRYAVLVNHHQAGDFEHLGTLPPDFPAKLRVAIDHSKVVEPYKKKFLRTFVDFALAKLTPQTKPVI